MTHRAETLDLKTGECRVCGCTELKPCAIESVDENGESAAPITCTWIDPERTLCSNPGCLAAMQGGEAPRPRRRVAP